ncbi:DUF202 domain-containing protein [Fontimonas sp. SYSU GA230001]|uniref:YidH family protein n=1 Tax=Fontimonas sp. SYSU GA230001 TaxID=3142450 RepID=UPI0032B5A204
MSSLQDPRVLFAAERTLLAWQRTCLTLMAFGFLIERFALFVHFLNAQARVSAESPAAYVLGIAFIATGAALALLATLQHRRVLRGLQPAEIPAGYWLSLAPVTTILTALLGLGVAAYLVLQ